MLQFVPENPGLQSQKYEVCELEFWKQAPLTQGDGSHGLDTARELLNNKDDAMTCGISNVHLYIVGLGQKVLYWRNMLKTN